MYNVICFILSALIAFLSLFGASPRPDETGNSIFIPAESDSRVFENSFTFSFERQKVNTAEIYFKNTGSAEVLIYNGDELIYRRTGTEDYRFCAFKGIETDSLRFVITGNTAKDVRLSYKTADASDFRVTAYVRVNSVQNKNSFVPENFDVITDVILIEGVSFDKNGALTVNDEAVSRALENTVEAINGRNVNIYMNIGGPGADISGGTWEEQMDSLSKNHSAAFKNPELVKSIKALSDKYGFDGIFFDYEYPLKHKYWVDFTSFLKKLKKENVGKIGIAVSDWNLSVTGELNSVVDMIELMKYDNFNSYGEHSSFSACPEGLANTEKYLIDRSKIDMGVPFYGRPTDSSAYWPGYAEFAQKLDGCDGCETGQVYSYFNCAQTIYDKTAYCMSRGIGGMMVWHYSCDVKDASSPYSLFSAMGRCIADRHEEVASKEIKFNSGRLF